MSKSESQRTTSEGPVNPYEVASGVCTQGTGRISWAQQAMAGGLSASVSLLVLTLLLTVLGLLVTIVYDMQPLSRESNHLMISALLVGGIAVSLGGSLFAGIRSFQRVRKIIGTLSGPTPARVELEEQVAAILRDRSSP